jgi:hypothetical protein
MRIGASDMEMTARLWPQLEETHESRGTDQSEAPSGVAVGAGQVVKLDLDRWPVGQARRARQRVDCRRRRGHDAAPGHQIAQPISPAAAGFARSR